MSTSARAPNRLSHETSPYLLQHARNPVDWYPWGTEAIDRSRRESKPIFLSIGYSACHWCHVMERESFENEGIARLMNEHFVNIKVDREERPDLDEIYMKAVQSLSGQGGWPMSVFLTPELEPFYGGTYFPPHGAWGRPGFADVLQGIARLWKEDRTRALEQGRRLRERIAEEGTLDARGELDGAVLERSLRALQEAFDPLWGGFGDAPKFPHAMDLRLLLRHATRTPKDPARQMVELTLTRMASGGIWDQLGGGFHRYSTDREWLIPHFEKMLYDNALLVPAYLEAYQFTGEPRFATIARETCEWMLREMRTPEGAFASSQDADSEGEEGRYFSWTPQQLRNVLGPRLGDWAACWYGVTEQGNFEGGASVLSRRGPAADVAARIGCDAGDLVDAMLSARGSLLAARATRPPPATDDKVLVAWNGLAVSALAMAEQVLEEPRYGEAAQTAANFLWTQMRGPGGYLFATSRGGRPHIPAGLDDHVFLLQGILDLYETRFESRWVTAARELAEQIEDRFRDERHDGYFTSAAGERNLIARLKGPQDGALPSGNAVHALNLLRLSELTGDPGLAQRAQSTILSQAELINRYPAAFGQMLLAVDFLRRGPVEIVLAGSRADSDFQTMLREIRARYLPNKIVAGALEEARTDLLPLLHGRTPMDGRVRAFVCRNYACSAPAEDLASLRRELDAVSSD